MAMPPVYTWLTTMRTLVMWGDEFIYSKPRAWPDDKVYEEYGAR